MAGLIQEQLYVYLESTTATLWVPQYCRSVHEETHRITMSNLFYATQLNFKGISVTQSRDLLAIHMHSVRKTAYSLGLINWNL